MVITSYTSYTTNLGTIIPEVGEVRFPDAAEIKCKDHIYLDKWVPQSTYVVKSTLSYDFVEFRRAWLGKSLQKAQCQLRTESVQSMDCWKYDAVYAIWPSPGLSTISSVPGLLGDAEVWAPCVERSEFLKWIEDLLQKGHGLAATALDLYGLITWLHIPKRPQWLELP